MQEDLLKETDPNLLDLHEKIRCPGCGQELLVGPRGRNAWEEHGISVVCDMKGNLAFWEFDPRNHRH